MRLTWEYFVAIGAAVLVVLVAWFSGSWFHLAGSDRAILSIGILIIGAAAIVGFLLWARSKQPPMPSAGVQVPQVPQAAAVAGSFSGSGLIPDDITVLVREAERKVASARLGHGAKLFGLRQVFILGDAGSGKTTVALQSGLDPELLAGQVFQEGSVVPTATANFWFARKSVLVEAGPSVLSEPRLWMRLVRSLSPGGFRSAFSRKSQGERAAVVCIDCEKFGAATSSDSLAGAARSLHARLAEMSQVLGSSVPVYVLFTKADRVPFFDDFVARFTNEEGSQVLGVTLPVSSDSTAGVYAERESKRLTTAFNNLFYSLADHRLGLLSREQNLDKRPDIYEYPREFSKVGKRVVQFLVELGRPSQLRAGPFLRGFYFTGLHMVGSSAGSPTMLASRTNMMAQAVPASNATTILRQEDLPALPGWESGTQIQATESRKVPQWIFLSHIFSHIILEDHSALGASGASTRSDLWRRILLAGTGVLLLIWILGSVVSYFSNRALERDFLAAAQTLPAATTSSQPLGLESLQQLDALRKQLQSLETYANVGAPWHLRWGLYSGDDIYPEARRIYFSHFRALMFGQIQASVVDLLRRLPATPGPNDEYGSNYDALKAYLITTSNPDKSTPEFLSPVLQRYLAGSQTLDANVLALARAQFDFYAVELKIQNPYSSVPDTATRDHARAYLSRFGAVPRIYAAMQNAASRQVQAVNFYRDHPDATDVLRSVPEVPGVFSKAGWDFMQNAIAHSDQYFHGEEWVLGGASEAVANRADLEAQIRSMYEADYIAHWQDFLRSTKVAAPYPTFDDGARKLKKLATNESSLLQLLCYASLNTAGRSQQIDKGFKPVQQVVPPACENRLITPLTTPYVAGLADLESCFEGVTAAPQEQKEAQRQVCNTSATKAKQVVAEQIVPAMDVDSQGHINQTVQHLLEEPLVVPAPPPLHGGDTKGLCDVFGRMATKYPFNSYNDAQDVTLQEFDEFFRPGDGVLAKFIQANQPVLVPQGAQYVLKPGAQANWVPTFLPFLSRVHSIQQALYPAGAVQPQYKFNVRAVLPEGGITGVSFTLNGQTLRYPGASQTEAFVWPGSGAQEARINYRTGGGQDTDLLSEPGPWAMVRILTVPDARVTSSGSTLSAEWHPTQADRRTPLKLTGTGLPIVVHLEFDAGGAPFVFQSATFSNLICRAAR